MSAAVWFGGGFFLGAAVTFTVIVVALAEGTKRDIDRRRNDD